MSGAMIRATAQGVTLAVRAQPGAKRTAIVGIAVQSPPVDGKANAALIEFLAETFGLARNRVEIVSGEISRSKVFLVRGVTRAQAERLFAPFLPIS